MSAAYRNSLLAGSRATRPFPRAALGQIRCLSSSQCRPVRSVIQFQPGGSPELKRVLGELREKVILPEYLTEEQQKKIYRKRYAAELRRHPISIEIDGKKHPFGYRDKVRDLPSTKKGLVTAINHMQTRANFEKNLEPLLEGVLGMAKRKAKPEFFTKVIRRAGQNGAIGAVLSCIYHARHTKFYLRTHEMINELMHQLQTPAIDSRWDVETTRKGIARVNKILEILEVDALKHSPLPDSGPTAFPYFRDPQFLAARLHLQAALTLKRLGSRSEKEVRDALARSKEARDAAAKAEEARIAAAVSGEGRDAAATPEEGREAPAMAKEVSEAVALVEEVRATVAMVVKYAREIVRLWPDRSGLLDIHPDAAYGFEHGLRYLLFRPTFVWTAAPILSALRMTQEVLARSGEHDELTAAIKQRADRVEAEIQLALPASLADGRAKPIYQKLFPKAASPKPAKSLEGVPEK